MALIPSFLLDLPRIFVRQKKEWVEIAIDFEMANQYAILDENQSEIGFVVESGGTFGTKLRRWFLRSHRPLGIDVFDSAKSVVMHLVRPFFFFFSDLTIRLPDGTSPGRVERRFGIFSKKYDLLDSTGKVFARIQSPIWRLWTFPVIDRSGRVRAQILKKWRGVLAEAFSDADTYQVDFTGQGRPGIDEWTPEQRAVIFAAAISIDFDFFENNQGRGGLLRVFDT